MVPIAVALLLLCQGAMAADVTVPGAGGQIRQIPPAPTEQRAVPEIRREQGSAPVVPAPDGARILVKSLHVVGQTLYSEEVLVAASGFVADRELTLAELRSMAARISDHYHRNGYFVAQAYLPAQEIKDGAVTIAVLEGIYGSVSLQNQTNLSDALANGLLDGLDSGDIIAIDPLENRLLLLSDIPGVQVRSTLTPGTSVGTSDLIVDLTPGRRVTGSVEADNAGYYYTGENRVGATVNFNNPTGHGDVATLRVLTSGSGMIYGRASYQMQFGRATAGIAYSALDYELGEEFESLDAHGTARIASIFGSYPLVRSRNTNHYVLAGFDDKEFEDSVDATSTFTEKSVQVGWVGLAGNHRDGFGGGGLSRYSFTVFAGELDIITPEALAVDEATAQANGQYQKLAFDVARSQNVTDTVALFGSVHGQVAGQNLDSSEKMDLGGPYGVRAYPVGEGYSDEAFVAQLEVRLLLSGFSERVPGQVQLIGFYDIGAGTINKDPWTDEDNSRTLSAAGAGITWADRNNFFMSVYYARKVGDETATAAPDSSDRYWLRGVKYF
jgi:hemolysin activation/secretion protein